MKAPWLRRSPGIPALEWFCDLSGKTARITSIGNKKLLVENHCGICCFTEECIQLASRCGCIEIRGNELTLQEVRRDALVVRGNISDVHLPCGEAKCHEP